MYDPRYQPMSQQQMLRSQNMTSINQAFSQNHPIIDTPDYTNSGKLLHNNLGDKLLNEYLIEYKMHIDSTDRDTSVFQSPFKIKLSFGNDNNSLNIERKFKNIKYISIDSIILPRTISIDTQYISTNKNIYPTGTTFSKNSQTAATATDNMTILANRKYLILKISELTSDQILSTSSLLTRDSILLTPDYSIGLDNVVWVPLHNSKIIYQNSSLSALSYLTFNLYDENGDDLNFYNNSGQALIGSTVTAIDGTNYNNYVKVNDTNLTVLYTSKVNQVLYNITFGVIENELTTQIKF